MNGFIWVHVGGRCQVYKMNLHGLEWGPFQNSTRVPQPTCIHSYGFVWHSVHPVSLKKPANQPATHHFLAGPATFPVADPANQQNIGDGKGMDRMGKG